MNDPSQYYDEPLGVKCRECEKNDATRRCSVCGDPLCPWDYEDHVKICEKDGERRMIAAILECIFAIIFAGLAALSYFALLIAIVHSEWPVAAILAAMLCLCVLLLIEVI